MIEYITREQRTHLLAYTDREVASVAAKEELLLTDDY